MSEDSVFQHKEYQRLLQRIRTSRIMYMQAQSQVASLELEIEILRRERQWEQSERDSKRDRQRKEINRLTTKLQEREAKAVPQPLFTFPLPERTENDERI